MRTIVTVDDDWDIIETVKAADSIGVGWMWTSDCKRVVAFVRAHHPDACVLDLMTGGCQGRTWRRTRSKRAYSCR